MVEEPTTLAHRLRSFRNRIPAAWRILWNRDDQRIYWSDGSWSYRSHIAGRPPTPRHSDLYLDLDLDED